MEAGVSMESMAAEQGRKRVERITRDEVEAQIFHEFCISGEQAYQAANVTEGIPAGSFSMLRNLTVCVLVLTNGTIVTGESMCGDASWYDEKIGRDEARKDAVGKVYAMMYFALRSKV